MEQTANYGQSGRNFECGDLGLEVDGSGVDAAIAVDRSREGSASLIGGEGGVLNKEELCADAERAVAFLAAVHPCRRPVGDGYGGGETVVGHGESDFVHHVPKLGIGGGVEDDLVALDGGARGTGYAVDGLPAVEESELIALQERVIIVNDRL